MTRTASQNLVCGVMKTDFVSLSNVLQYCNLMTPKEVQLLYMSCGVCVCVCVCVCVFACVRACVFVNFDIQPMSHNIT